MTTQCADCAVLKKIKLLIREEEEKANPTLFKKYIPPSVMFARRKKEEEEEEEKKTEAVQPPSEDCEKCKPACPGWEKVAVAVARHEEEEEEEEENEKVFTKTTDKFFEDERDKLIKEFEVRYKECYDKKGAITKSSYRMNYIYDGKYRITLYKKSRPHAKYDPDPFRIKIVQRNPSNPDGFDIKQKFRYGYCYSGIYITLFGEVEEDKDFSVTDFTMELYDETHSRFE